MKGPWPSPAVDEVEAVAAKYAEAWPAWGHRKIAALLRADGYPVSSSTVERALRRRGLLLPRGFRADRKSWAAIHRRVFDDPPTERNRVWQTDFSEFETAAGGIWRICAVIDNATKYCLAATVTPTARGQDALACLAAAVQLPNTSCSSRTCAPIAAKSTWSRRPPANCCAPSQRGSPSCPTTGRAFAAAYSPNHSPAKTRCWATSAPE